MIIKIDHIALASSDVIVDGLKLEKEGYAKKFQTLGLPNPEIKRGFMRNFKNKHDAALYERRGFIPIEIIDHKSRPEGCGYLLSKKESESGTSEIVVQTSNIEKSLSFWSLLGFRKTGKHGQLRFDSLVPKHTCIITLEEGGIAENKLDDAGFNCIAFITSSIERDNENLKKAGSVVSEISEFSSNNKKMKIMFARSKGGELIELIEPCLR
jgi:hypothetical protein